MNNSIIFRAKILMICIFLSTATECESENFKSFQSSLDFELIHQRIVFDIMEHPSEAEIKDILAKMTDTGTFNDVDYQSRAKYNWSPKLHIYRLFTLSSAFIEKGGIYNGNSVLETKILNGLKKWVELNPISDNWFPQAIQVPLKIGGTLLLLESNGSKIPQNLRDTLLNMMKEAVDTPYRYYDFNRTSIAQHWIYRAVLTNDTEILETAVNCIFDLQTIREGEDGYQIDGSFFHGGPQFYIGSYCLGSLTTVINTAMWVRGTDLKLSSEHLLVLRSFLLWTFPNCVRGNIVNYDCVGRSISMEGALIINSTDLLYDKIKQIDPEHSSDYEIAMRSVSGDYSPQSCHHTHHWIGDYTTHTRPHYSFSVGTCSTRTSKPEYGNGSNLKGYFLADGNTNLNIVGTEYKEIMPLWNWNFIPGTTAPVLQEIPLQKNTFGALGTSEFAGGVSDSIYGVTAYKYYDDYNDINTGANKGWFFFDDEIVCLGSNIRSAHEVITTVDQCWSEGSINRIIKEGTSLVLHNSVGYFFPEGYSYDLICNNEEVQGNWHDIDEGQKDSVVSGRVFLLAIKHDLSKQKGDKYAYYVVPGMKEKEAKAYFSKNDIEIVINSDSVQAVRHKTLGLWEMIFYKACKFSHSDIVINVSKACTLIYKYNKENRPVLHVADPGQTGKEIYFEIKDKKKGDDYIAKACYYETPRNKWGATKVVELERISSTGLHSIEENPRKCSVYDLKGNLVGVVMSDESEQLKKVVHKSGVYFVKGLSDGIMRTKKLIVR